MLVVLCQAAKRHFCLKKRIDKLKGNIFCGVGGFLCMEKFHLTAVRAGKSALSCGRDCMYLSYPPVLPGRARYYVMTCLSVEWPRKICLYI